MTEGNRRPTASQLGEGLTGFKLFDARAQAIQAEAERERTQTVPLGILTGKIYEAKSALYAAKLALKTPTEIVVEGEVPYDRHISGATRLVTTGRTLGIRTTYGNLDSLQAAYEQRRAEVEQLKEAKRKFLEEQAERERRKRLEEARLRERGLARRRREEAARRIGKVREVAAVDAMEDARRMLGDQVVNDIWATRVYDETPVAQTQAMSLPTGDRVRLEIVEEREMLDDPNTPLGEAQYRSYFHISRRTGAQKECEGQPKVPLAKLVPLGNHLGHDVAIVDDREMEAFIRERAKALGKKNQDLEGDISLIIGAMQKPELSSVLRLREGKKNSCVINGQRTRFFRFSPMGVLPKLSFQYPSDSERLRVTFAVHTIDKKTPVRVLIDLLDHNRWDEEHTFGLASHR